MTKKIKKKSKNGILKFLGIVLISYTIIAMVDFNLFLRSLIVFKGMLVKMLPLLLFVFLFMIITNLFLKGSFVKKHLGRESGIRGWLWAIIAGILISGAPYILFPLLKDLKEHGMRDSLITVFLYNRNIKIPFFPAMIFYFGSAFTVIISIYIMVFSVFAGLLMDKIMGKKSEKLV